MDFKSFSHFFKLSTKARSCLVKRTRPSRISYCLWSNCVQTAGGRANLSSQQIEGYRRFSVLSRRIFGSSSTSTNSSQLATTTIVEPFLEEHIRLPVFAVKPNRYSTNAMTDHQELTVNHDSKKNFFYINLVAVDGSSNPSHQAKLEYDWISSSHVDMHHTEVPPQFQGRGIAKHLAKAAFDHFSENSILMRPTCTYLQKYLKQNPLPKYIEHVEAGFK